MPTSDLGRSGRSEWGFADRTVKYSALPLPWPCPCPGPAPALATPPLPPSPSLQLQAGWEATSRPASFSSGVCGSGGWALGWEAGLLEKGR